MQIIKIKTRGNTDIINITDKVRGVLSNSKIKSGVVLLFVLGTTAGLTVIEHEPNSVKDIQESYEKIAPQNHPYHHHETWRDDNGNFHLRASLLKQD